jgi:hypothetical protein
MNKRKFDKLEQKQKIEILISMLSLSLRDEVWFPAIKRRTSIYGIACYYGKIYNIKKEDFNLIKNMTINEIVNLLDSKNRL